jgi:hypothetical protein
LLQDYIDKLQKKIAAWPVPMTETRIGASSPPGEKHDLFTLGALTGVESGRTVQPGAEENSHDGGPVATEPGRAGPGPGGRRPQRRE